MASMLTLCPCPNLRHERLPLGYLRGLSCPESPEHVDVLESCVQRLHPSSPCLAQTISSKRRPSALSVSQRCIVRLFRDIRLPLTHPSSKWAATDPVACRRRDSEIMTQRDPPFWQKQPAPFWHCQLPSPSRYHEHQPGAGLKG